MVNSIQKILYTLSLLVPLILIFAIVWVIQIGSFLVPVICLFVAIGVTVLFAISFSYGAKKLPKTCIAVTEISPKDNWIAVYVISYVIPFSSIILDTFNPIVTFLISLLLIIVISLINASTPNPLLLFKGYHFYSVNTEHGISGYVLISKRKLRNKNELTTVKRFFEFLLLDTEK